LDRSFKVGGNTRFKNQQRQKNVHKNSGIDRQLGEQVRHQVDRARQAQPNCDCWKCADANSDRRQCDGLLQLKPSGNWLAQGYDDH
jgi:hypothetical protein